MRDKILFHLLIRWLVGSSNDSVSSNCEDILIIEDIIGFSKIDIDALILREYCSHFKAKNRVLRVDLMTY